MSDGPAPHGSSASAEAVAAFRHAFDIVGITAYFANGSITPAPRPVIAVARAWQDGWMRDPQVAYRRYPQILEQLRATLAAFLGCDAEEIAITDNTSRGSILAARALARHPGRQVIVDRTTYPSSRYPWLALTDKTLLHVDDGGAEGPDAILSRIGAETCAVSVSHVDWFTGVRHDVAALARGAHERGAVLIVDGSQSVGAIPVDVRAADIDVLVGTFGKWLLAGPGLGFIYMKRALLKDVPMLEPGWRNFAAKGHGWPMEEMPSPAPGARVFEPGLPNVPGLVMAQAGLELVMQTGIGTIAAEIAALVERAWNGLDALDVGLLTPAAPERRAGLLAFPDARAPELAAALRADGVEITGYPYGHVRIDPHAFNTAAEVDAMLAAVRRYRGREEA